MQQEANNSVLYSFIYSVAMLRPELRQWVILNIPSFSIKNKQVELFEYYVSPIFMEAFLDAITYDAQNASPLFDLVYDLKHNEYTLLDYELDEHHANILVLHGADINRILRMCRKVYAFLDFDTIIALPYAQMEKILESTNTWIKNGNLHPIRLDVLLRLYEVAKNAKHSKLVELVRYQIRLVDPTIMLSCVLSSQEPASRCSKLL